MRCMRETRRRTRPARELISETVWKERSAITAGMRCRGSGGDPLDHECTGDRDRIDPLPVSVLHLQPPRGVLPQDRKTLR
jgi:hypothetical protein